MIIKKYKFNIFGYNLITRVVNRSANNMINFYLIQYFSKDEKLLLKKVFSYEEFKNRKKQYYL